MWHPPMHIQMSIKTASVQAGGFFLKPLKKKKKASSVKTHTNTHALTECTVLMRAPVEIWDTRTRDFEGAGDCN